MESDDAQMSKESSEVKSDILPSPQEESMEKGQMSPLTGAYLLIIISEPYSAEHRDKIIQRLTKGLLCWDIESSHVDLNCELLNLTNSPPEGDVAKNGEKLVQWASENLVVEVLYHSQVNTLIQCVKNLLSSFTRYRHVIHAGYSYQGSGSWILQDGTFSVVDFTELWDEPEVYRLLPAYKSDITVSLQCAVDNGWSDSRFRKEPFSKLCQLNVNGAEKLSNVHNAGIGTFVDYLSMLITPSPLKEILQPSDIVGNIRFSHPTLYVFPGGQGDAALFGVNGFNMLIDGGYSRKACFWDFTRHLDRLDAVLLTRVNNNDMGGIGALLERKNASQVFPQIGHFFGNVLEKKGSGEDESKESNDELILSLTEQGYEMYENLRGINMKPHFCTRENLIEPINLYHKVGHGKLDMYILNPGKDSKELKDFMTKWKAESGKNFATSKLSIRLDAQQDKECPFPVLNLVSICALLVWQPANPHSPITRILFPGSTPQQKIFESLTKLKHLEFLRYPICTGKTLASAHKSTVKSEKIITEVKHQLKSKEGGSYSYTTIESKVYKSVPKEAKTGQNKKQQLLSSGGRTETNSTTSVATVGDGVIKGDEPIIKKEPRKTETTKTVSKVISTTTTSSLDNKVRESRLSKFLSTSKTPTPVTGKVLTKPSTGTVQPIGLKRTELKEKAAEPKEKLESMKQSSPSSPSKKDLNGSEKSTTKYGISKSVSKVTATEKSLTTSPKQSKEDTNRKVIEHKSRATASSTSSVSKSEHTVVDSKIKSTTDAKEIKSLIKETKSTASSKMFSKGVTGVEKTKSAAVTAKLVKANEEKPVSKIRPTTAKPLSKSGDKSQGMKNGTKEIGKTAVSKKIIGGGAAAAAAAVAATTAVASLLTPTKKVTKKIEDSKLQEEEEEKGVEESNGSIKSPISEEGSPNSIIQVLSPQLIEKENGIIMTEDEQMTDEQLKINEIEMETESEPTSIEPELNNDDLERPSTEVSLDDPRGQDYFTETPTSTYTAISETETPKATRYTVGGGLGDEDEEEEEYLVVEKSIEDDGNETEERKYENGGRGSSALDFEPDEPQYTSLPILSSESIDEPQEPITVDEIKLAKPDSPSLSQEETKPESLQMEMPQGRIDTEETTEQRTSDTLEKTVTKIEEITSQTTSSTMEKIDETLHQLSELEIREEFEKKETLQPLVTSRGMNDELKDEDLEDSLEVEDKEIESQEPESLEYDNESRPKSNQSDIYEIQVVSTSLDSAIEKLSEEVEIEEEISSSPTLYSSPDEIATERAHEEQKLKEESRKSSRDDKILEPIEMESFQDETTIQGHGAVDVEKVVEKLVDEVGGVEIKSIQTYPEEVEMKTHFESDTAPDIKTNDDILEKTETNEDELKMTKPEAEVFSPEKSEEKLTAEKKMEEEKVELEKEEAECPAEAGAKDLVVTESEEKPEVSETTDAAVKLLHSEKTDEEVKDAKSEKEKRIQEQVVKKEVTEAEKIQQEVTEKEEVKVVLTQIEEKLEKNAVVKETTKTEREVLHMTKTHEKVEETGAVQVKVTEKEEKLEETEKEAKPEEKEVEIEDKPEEKKVEKEEKPEEKKVGIEEKPEEKEVEKEDKSEEKKVEIEEKPKEREGEKHEKPEEKEVEREEKPKEKEAEKADKLEEKEVEKEEKPEVKVQREEEPEKKEVQKVEKPEKKEVQKEKKPEVKVEKEEKPEEKEIEKKEELEEHGDVKEVKSEEMQVEKAKKIVEIEVHKELILETSKSKTAVIEVKETKDKEKVAELKTNLLQEIEEEVILETKPDAEVLPSKIGENIVEKQDEKLATKTDKGASDATATEEKETEKELVTLVTQEVTKTEVEESKEEVLIEVVHEITKTDMKVSKIETTVEEKKAEKDEVQEITVIKDEVLKTEGKIEEKEVEKEIEKTVDKEVRKLVTKEVEKEAEETVVKREEEPAEKEVEKAVEKKVQKAVEMQVEKIIENVENNMNKEIEEPIEKEIEKIVEKEIEKSVDKELQETIEEEIQILVEKEIVKLVEKEIEKSVEKEIHKPVETEVLKSFEKRIEEPIEEEMERKIGKEIDLPVEKEIMKLVEKVIEKSVEIEIVKPVEKESEKSAAKEIEKSVEQEIEQVVKKVEKIVTQIFKVEDSQTLKTEKTEVAEVENLVIQEAAKTEVNAQPTIKSKDKVEEEKVEAENKIQEATKEEVLESHVIQDDERNVEKEVETLVLQVVTKQLEHSQASKTEEQLKQDTKHEIDFLKELEEEIIAETKTEGVIIHPTPTGENMIIDEIQIEKYIEKSTVQTATKTDLGVSDLTKPENLEAEIFLKTLEVQEITETEPSIVTTEDEKVAVPKAIKTEAEVLHVKGILGKPEVHEADKEVEDLVVPQTPKTDTTSLQEKITEKEIKEEITKKELAVEATNIEVQHLQTSTILEKEFTKTEDELDGNCIEKEDIRTDIEVPTSVKTDDKVDKSEVQHEAEKVIFSEATKIEKTDLPETKTKEKVTEKEFVTEDIHAIKPKEEVEETSADIPTAKTGNKLEEKEPHIELDKEEKMFDKTKVDEIEEEKIPEKKEDKESPKVIKSDVEERHATETEEKVIEKEPQHEVLKAVVAEAIKLDAELRASEIEAIVLEELEKQVIPTEPIHEATAEETLVQTSLEIKEIDAKTIHETQTKEELDEKVPEKVEVTKELIIETPDTHHTETENELKEEVPEITETETDAENLPATQKDKKTHEKVFEKEPDEPGSGAFIIEKVKKEIEPVTQTEEVTKQQTKEDSQSQEMITVEVKDEKIVLTEAKTIDSDDLLSTKVDEKIELKQTVETVILKEVKVVAGDDKDTLKKDDKAEVVAEKVAENAVLPESEKVDAKYLPTTKIEVKVQLEEKVHPEEKFEEKILEKVKLTTVSPKDEKLSDKLKSEFQGDYNEDFPPASVSLSNLLPEPEVIRSGSGVSQSSGSILLSGTEELESEAEGFGSTSSADKRDILSQLSDIEGLPVEEEPIIEKEIISPTSLITESLKKEDKVPTTEKVEMEEKHDEPSKEKEKVTSSVYVETSKSRMETILKAVDEFDSQVMKSLEEIIFKEEDIPSLSSRVIEEVTSKEEIDTLEESVCFEEPIICRNVTLTYDVTKEPISILEEISETTEKVSKVEKIESKVVTSESIESKPITIESIESKIITSESPESETIKSETKDQITSQPIEEIVMQTTLSPEKSFEPTKVEKEEKLVTDKEKIHKDIIEKVTGELKADPNEEKETDKGVTEKEIREEIKGPRDDVKFLPAEEIKGNVPQMIIKDEKLSPVKEEEKKEKMISPIPILSAIASVTEEIIAFTTPTPTPTEVTKVPIHHETMTTSQPQEIPHEEEESTDDEHGIENIGIPFPSSGPVSPGSSTQPTPTQLTIIENAAKMTSEKELLSSNQKEELLEMLNQDVVPSVKENENLEKEILQKEILPSRDEKIHLEKMTTSTTIETSSIGVEPKTEIQFEKVIVTNICETSTTEKEEKRVEEKRVEKKIEEKIGSEEIPTSKVFPGLGITHVEERIQSVCKESTQTMTSLTSLTSISTEDKTQMVEQSKEILSTSELIEKIESVEKGKDEVKVPTPSSHELMLKHLDKEDVDDLLNVIEEENESTSPLQVKTPTTSVVITPSTPPITTLAPENGYIPVSEKESPLEKKEEEFKVKEPVTKEEITAEEPIGKEKIKEEESLQKEKIKEEEPIKKEEIKEEEPIKKEEIKEDEPIKKEMKEKEAIRKDATKEEEPIKMADEIKEIVLTVNDVEKALEEKVDSTVDKSSAQQQLELTSEISKEPEVICIEPLLDNQSTPDKSETVEKDKKPVVSGLAFSPILGGDELELKPSSDDSSVSSSAMTVISAIIEKAEEEVRIHKFESTNKKTESSFTVEKKTTFYVGDEDEPPHPLDDKSDEDDGIYELDNPDDDEMSFTGSAVRTGLLTAAATLSATIIRQPTDVENIPFGSTHSSRDTSPVREDLKQKVLDPMSIKHKAEDAQIDSKLVESDKKSKILSTSSEMDVDDESPLPSTPHLEKSFPKVITKEEVIIVEKLRKSSEGIFDEDKYEMSSGERRDSTRSIMGSDIEDELQFPGDAMSGSLMEETKEGLTKIPKEFKPSAPILKDEGIEDESSEWLMCKVPKTETKDTAQPIKMTESIFEEPKFEKMTIIREMRSEGLGTTTSFEKVKELIVSRMEEMEDTILQKTEEVTHAPNICTIEKLGSISTEIEEPLFERMHLSREKKEVIDSLATSMTDDNISSTEVTFKKIGEHEILMATSTPLSTEKLTEVKITKMIDISSLPDSFESSEIKEKLSKHIEEEMKKMSSEFEKLEIKGSDDLKSKISSTLSTTTITESHKTMVGVVGGGVDKSLEHFEESGSSTFSTSLPPSSLSIDEGSKTITEIMATALDNTTKIYEPPQPSNEEHFSSASSSSLLLSSSTMEEMKRKDETLPKESLTTTYTLKSETLDDGEPLKEKKSLGFGVSTFESETLKHETLHKTLTDFTSEIVSETQDSLIQRTDEKLNKYLDQEFHSPKTSVEFPSTPFTSEASQSGGLSEEVKGHAIGDSTGEERQGKVMEELVLSGVERVRTISSSSVESHNSSLSQSSHSQEAGVKGSDLIGRITPQHPDNIESLDHLTQTPQGLTLEFGKKGSSITTSSRRFSSMDTETFAHQSPFQQQRRGSEIIGLIQGIPNTEQQLLETLDSITDAKEVTSPKARRLLGLDEIRDKEIEKVEGESGSAHSQKMSSFSSFPGDMTEEPSTSYYSQSQEYETFIIGGDETTRQTLIESHGPHRRTFITSEHSSRPIGFEVSPQPPFSELGEEVSSGDSQPQSLAYLPQSTFSETQLNLGDVRLQFSSMEPGDEGKWIKSETSSTSFPLSEGQGTSSFQSEWKVTTVTSTTRKVGDGPAETKSETFVTTGGTAPELLSMGMGSLQSIPSGMTRTTTLTTTTSGGTTTSQTTEEEEDILKKWGKPLGLPGIHPDDISLEPTPNEGRLTPKKDVKTSKTPSTPKSGSQSGKPQKRSTSHHKTKNLKPIYVDLAYVPHHGNSNYSDSEFFRLIRSRYYVFSGLEPSREVFDGLLHGKQEWEDKNLEVTIVPTYDTDTLGYWVVDSEVALAEGRIDLAPSASRCTINLQDHETSCSAYRLEF